MHCAQTEPLHTVGPHSNAARFVIWLTTLLDLDSATLAHQSGHCRMAMRQKNNRHWTEATQILRSEALMLKAPSKREGVKRPRRLHTDDSDWGVDADAVKRYRSNLTYDDIKELARRCLRQTVFLCDGFRIRPGADVSDFASLNNLKPSARSVPPRFRTVSAKFSEDFNKLINHIGLNRPAVLNFRRECRILEKVLGRRLSFTVEPG